MVEPGGAEPLPGSAIPDSHRQPEGNSNPALNKTVLMSKYAKGGGAASCYRKLIGPPISLVT